MIAAKRFAAARIGSVACALALTQAALGPAIAQTPAKPLAPSAVTSPEQGRYTMTPTPDGFLRLDTRSGAVSLCKIEADSARCRIAADERSALDDEIARLSKDNAALRAKLAGNDKPGADYGWKLPNERDIDAAMNYAQRMVRRMLDYLNDSGSQKGPT